MSKPLSLTALALCLAAGFSGAATAHGDGHASGAPQQAAPSITPSADALTVVRDAATGKLRAPTAAEMAELISLQQQQRSSTGPQRRAKPTMLARQHPGGATSVRLTDEMVSYAVVQRQADGGLTHQCLDSAEHAHAAVHQPAPQPAVATARRPALETQ